MANGSLWASPIRPLVTAKYSCQPLVFKKKLSDTFAYKLSFYLDKLINLLYVMLLVFLFPDTFHEMKNGGKPYETPRTRTLGHRLDKKLHEERKWPKTAWFKEPVVHSTEQN